MACPWESPGRKRTRARFCSARLALCSDLVVEARLIASVTDVEIKTLPCRIARMAPLAPDVMQVFLRLPVVERLEFHPGQYLDILLDNGRRRSFSIASPPHDSELLELHVRRVPGGGFTEGLWGATGVGSLLRIEGPIGQFVYQEGSSPVLMIAGGTGFAPLKSMLRHVLERGIDRPVHLYWGARQAQDVYEEALVLEWVRKYPQLTFTTVLSEATGDRLTGQVGCTRRYWLTIRTSSHSRCTQRDRRRSLKRSGQPFRGRSGCSSTRSTMQRMPAAAVQIRNRSRSSLAIRRLTCRGASHPRNLTKYWPSALRSMPSR